jgi:general secretion pathway protein K
MDSISIFRIPNSAFGNRRGVALLMVLWVIAILSVVVLEFSFAMRTEIHITKNLKEEAQLYALAEGGIQRAIIELVYKYDSKIQAMRKGIKTEETSPEEREWMTDGRVYQLPFQQGICDIRIMGEGGKVNINIVSEAVLRKIISQMGLEGEERDIVVDSILDWRDPDDFYRINGAENDYYQALKEPYYCKNSNFDSLEELLLVRGVTSDLLYGKKRAGTESEGVGLKDIFSVYSLGEQIDINSATLPLMKIFLGIPSDIAQLIVKAREEKDFLNQQDLIQRVPQLIPLAGEWGRFILFQSSLPYYTIESKAKGSGGESIRGLKAIVKIDSKEKKGYKIVQWVDKMI